MTAVLLGEWGFLDNLNDTSGNGHAATVNYTPVYVDGPHTHSRGVSFTGNTQTITYGRTGLEPLAAAGGICTMAWIKLSTSVAGYLGGVHKFRDIDALSTRHGCDLVGNKLRPLARWRDQLNFIDGTGPDLANNAWHHLCVVDADDRYEFYVDGVSIVSSSRTGTSPVSWENYPWFSGFSGDMNSNSAFSISGVRIFSGSLSDSDVVQWMDTPIVPASTSGVIIGGVKKSVSSKSVIIGGTKKVVTGSYVIVSGQKKLSN